MTGTRRFAVSLVIVGMLLSVLSLWRPVLAFDAVPDFRGVCTSATYPMTCTLDEPEGVNPATHGTITIERAGNVFTFTWAPPAGATLVPAADAIKLCVAPKVDATNPFVPTHANTCVGAAPSKYAAFPVVYDAGPLLAAAGATDAWFALHVDIRDGGNRTTYVVGPGVATNGTTTTSSSTTTTTTVSSTTTTTSTTSPSTTTTLRQDSVTSTPSASSVQPAEASRTEVLGVTLESELPPTGPPSPWPLAVGLTLVLVGGVLLVVGRRPVGT